MAVQVTQQAKGRKVGPSGIAATRGIPAAAMRAMRAGGGKAAALGGVGGALQVGLDIELPPLLKKVRTLGVPQSRRFATGGRASGGAEDAYGHQWCFLTCKTGEAASSIF